MSKNSRQRITVTTKYRGYVDGQTRETVSLVELDNLKLYLEQKEMGVVVLGGFWRRIFGFERVYAKDFQEGVDITVRTSVCSHHPYALKLRANISFPESSLERAAQLALALVNYNYFTMRGNSTPPT